MVLWTPHVLIDQMCLLSYVFMNVMLHVDDAPRGPVTNLTVIKYGKMGIRKKTTTLNECVIYSIMHLHIHHCIV